MLTNKRAGGNLLLAALPNAERKRIIDSAERVELGSGAELHEPGAAIRFVYFPIDCTVSLLTPGAARARHEIGLVGREGMLGLSLLLGVANSPLSARVLQAGRAWRLDADSFLSALEQFPALRRTLHRHLYVHLSQLVQTAACARFHPLEARLARWLLMTSDRARSTSFHVTHELLATLLGVRRVGVTSAASSMQKRALIRYNRGAISILDPAGLRDAACACYSLDRKTYLRVLGAKSAAGVRRKSPTGADVGAFSQISA